MTSTLQNETTVQTTPEPVPAEAMGKVPFAIINKYAKLLHIGPYNKEAPEHKKRIKALQSKFAANSSLESPAAAPSAPLEEMAIPAENSKLFNRYASPNAMFDHLKQEIIGHDAALRTIIAAMTKSNTECPIIRLYGEPGLGKSYIVNRVAKAIGAECNVFYARDFNLLGSTIMENASTVFNKKVVLGIDEACRLTARNQMILSELACKQIPGADVTAIFLMDIESEPTQHQRRDPNQFDRLNEAFWSRVTNVELTMPDNDSFAQILERIGLKVDKTELSRIVEAGDSVRSVLKHFHARNPAHNP